MLEDKEKASLNGFHSKYTDGVYGSEKRQTGRVIKQQRKYMGSK